MLCQIRDAVSRRIGPNRFDTWFGEQPCFDLDGSRLDVRVQNEFAANWIASNYIDALTDAARDVVGGDVLVHVSVQGDGNPHPAGSRPAPGCGGNGHGGNGNAVAGPGANGHAGESPTAGHGRFGVYPGASRGAGREPRSTVLRHHLSTFVVGPSNRLAFAAAAEIARAPGAGLKLLIVHGACGLGKTHLLQGICNAAREHNAALDWRYLSGEEFTNEFIGAVKSNRSDQFRARFRKVELLVIDDIHFLENKRATQDEFLHTFDAIDAAGRAVVLSSDRHPRAIATLSDALINRLISGVVVEIQPPDHETRLQILRQRALTMNVELADDVLEFIARHIRRNVRELEGALYKLAALSVMSRDVITLDVARLVLEENMLRGQNRLEATDVERVVTGFFGVTRDQVHSKSRDRTVTLARGVAMYLVRKHTPLSFPEIGRLMGGKNHSTVLMAAKRIEELLARGAEVAWKNAQGQHHAGISDLLEGLDRELRLAH